MEPKKTILKSISAFFKNHSEDKPKDVEIKDKQKKSILKVIDTGENLSDRTTDTTFPNPSEPVISDKDNLEHLKENFKTDKTDYEIEDLTKNEDIASNETQPPVDDDININEILKDLDGKLDESDHNHVLNILTTRSSKDNDRESALLEYTVYGKSYVLSLIVEKEDSNYKYSLKSSYGKEVYSKTVSKNQLNETIYYPFEAIALRDKYNPVLKEKAFVGLNDRQKSYLKTFVKRNDNAKEALENELVESEVYDKLRDLQSNDNWSKRNVLETIDELSK